MCEDGKKWQVFKWLTSSGGVHWSWGKMHSDLVGPIKKNICTWLTWSGFPSFPKKTSATKTSWVVWIWRLYIHWIIRLIVLYGKVANSFIICNHHHTITIHSVMNVWPNVTKQFVSTSNILVKCSMASALEAGSNDSICCIAKQQDPRLIRSLVQIAKFQKLETRKDLQNRYRENFRKWNEQKKNVFFSPRFIRGVGRCV